MFVQGRASLRLESDLLGDDYNQRFEPLSRDYKVADQWDWVNLSMTPFASVLYSKLRRRNVQSGQESLATVQQNPDELLLLRFCIQSYVAEMSRALPKSP